jgi:hypothetical protein
VNAVGATTVEAPGERSVRGFIRRKRREERGVSFPELVWVHFLRQRELQEDGRQPYEGRAEERYREFEKRFEAKHGAIVSQYWCTTEASGIALTIKRRPLLLADTVKLHWATDWSTKDKPKLMRLLYECETLAVRVQEVLRDTSRRLAIQSLFNVISFLLAFAETEHSNDDRAVAEVTRSTRAGLKEIDTYYRNAASRSGQIVYVGGMLLGMVPPLLLSIAGWIVIGLGHHAPPGHPHQTSTASAIGIGLLCFSAGAVGALMSVMSRLSSGKVKVDWEFGKDTLRTLGSLRPFVGAVFGLMTYVALKSGVIGIDLSNKAGSSYYFVVFSFAAGFSERLAQDMLLGPTVGAVVGRGKRRGAEETGETTGLPETTAA